VPGHGELHRGWLQCPLDVHLLQPGLPVLFRGGDIFFDSGEFAGQRNFAVTAAETGST
jgi:hypothetical protein